MLSVQHAGQLCVSRHVSTLLPNAIFMSPGPKLPDLPDQYSTTIEANLVEANLTLTGYEYFDNPGNRATLKIEAKDVLHTIVFDYANKQLFYVSGMVALKCYKKRFPFTGIFIFLYLLSCRIIYEAYCF